MSDFDKEAEREKLRKKYANEQKDRESTQRMSDLLLQGATMTNKHCDTCGDPVFRYEGQEFCASCQAAGGAAGGAADAGNQPGSRESSAPAETAPESEAAARAVADEERTDPVDTGSQPSEVRESESESPTPADSRELPTETRSVSAGSDLSEAREELGRTIATLARRAADAEDPRRAREFLEAADEAANTLSTLNGR